MESADCHRRASDADQSAWSYSTTVECAPVKEEPEWGACGVSEAAARAGLYAGHELKEELVVGPELLQPQDVVYSIRVLPLNQDGPEDIKPAPTGPGVRPGSDSAPQRQLALRACSVRLQRLPVDNKTYPFKTYLQLSEFGSSILSNSSVPGKEQTNPKTKKYKKKVKDETQKNILTCDTCGKQFVRKNMLIKHMKMHTIDKTNSCPICNRVFKSYLILKRHAVTHIHADEIPFTCKICGMRFSRKFYLKRHSHLHTGQKPYPCDICNKRFGDLSNCIKHKKLHSGEKPHACRLCKSKFTQKTFLTKHMQSHMQTKSFLYEFCNKSFNVAHCLRKHRLLHSGEKPYTCQTCNKQFTQSAGLYQHMLVHTREKPFSCETCNKQFRSRSNLAQHKLLHTGEKRHCCQICEKKFVDKSNLTSHMRTHTEDKPYTCEICSKQYRQKNSLDQHKQVHKRKLKQNQAFAKCVRNSF